MNSKNLSFNLLVGLLFLIGCVENKLTPRLINEGNLIKSLMNGYERSIRPNDTVDVNVTVYLHSIDSILDKEQIMISSCYISQSWFDPRFEWEPNNYSGIETIMIEAKKIWMPDTFVLNTADTNGYFNLNEHFSLASVHFDGQVYIMIPVVSLKTRCDLNSTAFPFDEQNCEIVFTGWSHPSDRVHYRESQDDLNLANYIQNPVWILDKTESNVSVRYWNNRVPFEETKNAEIVIKLILRRRPLFFVANNVIAFLLLNILTLFLFYVPFSDQVSLSITIFLTFAVFMSSIANQIPEQSEYIGDITYYSLSSLVLNVSILIWFIIKYNIKKSGRFPKWLAWARYFYILQERTFSCCGKQDEFDILEKNSKKYNEIREEILKSSDGNSDELKDLVEKGLIKKKPLREIVNGLNFIFFILSILGVLSMIFTYIGFTIMHNKN